jgi:tetratricopeptide (TPR) repeat protein
MYLAEYDKALTYCQRAQQRMSRDERRAQIARFGFDFQILARCVAVQILGSKGLVDQAAVANREVLAEAEARGHPLTLALTLSWCGCRRSLSLGDVETAERSVARLKTIAEGHGLANYYFASVGFSGQLLADRGDLSGGIELIRSALKGFRAAEHEYYYTAFLMRLAAILASAARYQEARAAIDEDLERIKRSRKSWFMVDALRIKGDVLMISPGAEAAEAANCFNQSLDFARREGALHSELLAAMSYGRWLCAGGQPAAAHELLSSVCARFTEGSNFRVLQTAKRLASEWASQAKATSRISEILSDSQNHENAEVRADAR